MNTLVCQEPKVMIWKKREIPMPGDNEALIKIKTVGICGTDIHAWAGNQPFFSYPRVLGHEICGEIVGLGKNINHLHNGQQVAVIPYVACRKCPACRSGRTNCCENISVIGVHQDGLVHISSLADKFVEDPHTVVKAGDIVKVKVLEVDLQRKRIALTMRLDEQPGDSNSRRGNGGAREAGNRPAARPAKPRGRESQPAGNSAMMDALAAAMGKKR